MQRESTTLLWDAREAVDRIVRFVSGKSLTDYLADELLRAAVERQLEIVGEALGRLRARDHETASRVPELDRIVALRNVLIHGYATVDDRLVWAIVETKLTSLRDSLHMLLPGP